MSARADRRTRPRWPPTLRARLIASAAGATFVAVALLGVAVTLLVDHQLRSDLDSALRQRASDVARLAVSAPALLTAPGALEAPIGGRQLSVEVVDARGRIVARSVSLGGRLLPGDGALTAALERGRDGYRDARLSGSLVRLYAAPIAATGGPASGGAVIVASDSSEIEHTRHRLRGLVALSALAAAALGALAAAFLTGRGLRPLRDLSHAASQIERAGDASLRLPESRSGGELAELGATLNRMLAALERAQETERRFLADASHELRTPITSLRGNAAYVARHGPNPEVLADIEADAARLGRLLDDLLALEREEAATRPADSVRLDELARSVAAGDPRVRVSVEDRAEPVVRGEAGALERALRNLIDNARVHGPPEGMIDVRLRERDGHALLSVSDEGPGLAAEEIAPAFQRFWRGRGAGERPGSGLGLSIVAATAARHGGRVTASGSSFTLELPLFKGFSSSRSSLSVSPVTSERKRQP